jgi:hypothetical protein
MDSAALSGGQCCARFHTDWVELELPRRALNALAFFHKKATLGERGWRGSGGLWDKPMPVILTIATDRACIKGAFLCSLCGYRGVAAPRAGPLWNGRGRQCVWR